MGLLSINADAKTVKGNKQGVLTGILYLAPANVSGWEVCPKASPGCRASCLYTAGRGIMRNVQEGRLRKTTLFFTDRVGFFTQLSKDIEALVRKADRLGMIPAVRLNGTSDLPWERIRIPGEQRTIIEKYADVQFYDYTKDSRRIGKTPANYDLTFSRSEENDAECQDVLARGGRVAVVFRSVPLDVIQGDGTDARFLEGPGVVGLTPKGQAKHDKTGFVL